VYDSAGATEGNRNERAESEFNAGVSLYVDPDHGVVRGQVKLLRDAPEQFVATYQGDDADLLSAFAKEVVEMADEKGWQIRRDAGGNQALFDAFASGQAFDQGALDRVRRTLERRDLPLARLHELLAADEPVDLAVPDYVTAAQTIALVERRIDGSHTLAVSESTTASTVRDTDLFVIPTGRVDEATPGPNLRERFRRQHAVDARAEFESAVAGLASVVDERDAASAVVAALDEADTEREVQFRAADGPPVWLAGLGPRFVASSAVAGVFALVAAVLLSPADLLSLLAVSPTYPVVGSLGVPAWQIMGPAVGLGVIGLLLATNPAFGGTVGRSARTEETVPAAADREARAVASALQGLAETVDRDSFRTATAEVLAPYGIDVLDAETVSRNRRIRAALGGGGGVLVGVALFGLISAALPIIEDTLRHSVSAVTLVFAFGSMAMFGLGLFAERSGGNTASSG
jgi:hypothetical protein